MSLGSTTAGVKPRHWLLAAVIIGAVAALGWLERGHIAGVADRTAAITASRVAASVAVDAVASRPITVTDLAVTSDPDGEVTIVETVQVRESCQGERLDRWALWPDGRTENVTPTASSDDWIGTSFSNDLGPGSHRVWVRYHWPPDNRPLLYFVRADFRQAQCPSGYKGEYLVLYREMEAG